MYTHKNAVYITLHMWKQAWRRELGKHAHLSEKWKHARGKVEEKKWEQICVKALTAMEAGKKSNGNGFE